MTTKFIDMRVADLLKAAAIALAVLVLVGSFLLMGGHSTCPPVPSAFGCPPR